MSYLPNRNYFYEVSTGRITGKSTVHKFGYASVGTTLQPVCSSGVYQVPTTLQGLEIVSSSANDTNGGSGAQTVYVEGIGTGWAVVSETVTMNGLTAVALANQYFRIYRWYVVSSGTYASATAGSHVGTLTIRAAGAGATWSTLPISPFPVGQSLIAAYTVPTGKTARLLNSYLTVDTAKTVDALFFYRPSADDVSTPYNAMRLQHYYVGLTGATTFHHDTAEGYTGPCDIGWMAKVSTGTADVSAEFEFILE